MKNINNFFFYHAFHATLTATPPQNHARSQTHALPGEFELHCPVTTDETTKNPGGFVDFEYRTNTVHIHVQHIHVHFNHGAGSPRTQPDLVFFFELGQQCTGRRVASNDFRTLFEF